MLDISIDYFNLLALLTETQKICAPTIITTQMRKLCTVLAGIYVFQVNNRNTTKGVIYVQS